jgi:serine/threonine-protein kinase
VVHRDLKPSNLMVTPEGRLKLTDFGIAKDLDATALTATGRTLGTAAYMAPEQIRGAPAVSHKTDLYALGLVLYQLLVGKPPFEGSSPMILMHNHLNEPPPRPSAKV